MQEKMVQEQVTESSWMQDQEEEQALYMVSMRPEWAWEDALYKHMRNCVDPECGCND